jgi:hypothetical protein
MKKWVLIVILLVAGAAFAENKQKATDYYESPQRLKDDIELNWGDGDDVKSFWDSAASLLKFTDAAGTVIGTMDPSTRAFGVTGNLVIGDGSATDFTITVDASANDGVLTWDESAAEWEFSDSIVVAGSGTIAGGVISALTNNWILSFAQSTGNALLRIEALPSDGTSLSEIRIGRLTNTTGTVKTVWFKGNGSAVQTAVLDMVTGSLQLDGTLDATGDITTAGDAHIDGGQIDSTGDLEVTPAGDDFLIDSARVNFRDTNVAQLTLRKEDVTISSGDILGQLSWSGDDAVAVNTAGARIRAIADGAWSSGDNPTRLEFLVVEDGSGTVAVAGTIFNDKIVQWEGAIRFLETTTPTPNAGYGAIYTKTDDGLYFQDGSGNEHTVHLPAFSEMWFHSATTSDLTLTTQNAFFQFVGFANLGLQGSSGLVSGSVANDEFTVATGGAGDYTTMGKASLDVTGTNQEVMTVVGIELATALTITDATNASPIVITSASHGLLDGDMCTISGVTGNTAANGDWMADAVAANTFALLDLAGANSTGNGAYVSGGTVDVIYPGNTVAHRMYATTDIGVIPFGGRLSLADGDVVNLHFANITSAAKVAEVTALSMRVERIDTD